MYFTPTTSAYDSPLPRPKHEQCCPLNSGCAQDFKRYGKAMLEVLQETLWPIRCTLCDRPGLSLCEDCRKQLPFIDHWRACPRCGAPHGSVQCSECNPIKLKNLGEKALPFEGCVSVVRFDENTARLVKTYKDQNEQSLAHELARLMAQVLPPTWKQSNKQVISYIPATKKALLRRGFDHAELLAEKLSRELTLPLLSLFERPKAKDQRKLSRQERIRNMNSRFTLTGNTLPSSVLLVDDVYTTGSTFIAASKTLTQAGVQHIHCASFARVW